VAEFPFLHPTRSIPTYPIRAPLVRWLGEEAVRAHKELGRYRVLDVGCGLKPYQPLFSAYAAEYVGVDPVDNPHADLKGSVEDLPVGDASFDLVLCVQVLEHAADPMQGVRELHRVTAAGGRVLASTHGVMTYHPAPTDYWRWTHAGLAKLFTDNGTWSSLRITPGSGTTACVGMIVSMNLDVFFRQVLHAGLIARPLVSAINGFCEFVDGRSTRLRDPGQQGTLFANFHVTAEVAA
jgi:SAM-dependent methyltransferase